MLRIRDVYFGSRIRNLHPRIQDLEDTGSRFQSRGNMIRDVHPGSEFFPISDPDPGSRTQGLKAPFSTLPSTWISYQFHDPKGFAKIITVYVRK